MAWRMVRDYRKPASEASIFDEPLAAANFSKYSFRSGASGAVTVICFSVRG